jgi:hypothetical protein
MNPESQAPRPAAHQASISDSLAAADTAALSDLAALKTETPANTPAVVEKVEAAVTTPETVVTPVADTLTKEPGESKEDYEARYKELQRTFTQRNQQDARDREELAATKEREAKWQRWYQQYEEHQRAQQNPEDLDAVPTTGQVKEEVAKTLQKERAALLNEVRTELATHEVKKMERDFAKELGRYAQELVDSEPLLKAQLDDPEDTSLYELIVKHAQTKLFGPNADPDEVRDLANFKAHMKTFADRKANNLKKLIKNHEEVAVVRASKANKPTIASPGGSIAAVMTPSKPPKWGTDAFREASVNWVREAQAEISARK